ncbi:MAG: YjfB family protein [Hydrogenovibrio sp.]|nr:YjfB family protein [Hydrogenovibrio sp.]
MDMSPTAAVNMAMATHQGSNAQQAQLMMLKKAMNIQTQGALSLIESLPSNTPSSRGLPAHIGNHINTTA